MTWRNGSWDFISIDGEQLNGQCLKFDVKQKRNIQVTAVPRSDGPQLTDQGYTGSDITIVIRAWRESQFKLLSAQITRIHPRQLGALKRPLAVVHPLAAAFNIATIVIEEVAAGLPTSQGWDVVIAAKQWFKARKPTVPGSPKAGGTLDLPGVPDPDPSNLGPKWP